MSGEEGGGKMKEANTEWKADPIPVQGNSQNTLGLVLMLIVWEANYLLNGWLKQTLPSHIFKETQRNRKQDSKKRSCIQQHSMFTFCALCSDNQMCLEVQKTKLAKVKSKQLTMYL